MQNDAKKSNSMVQGIRLENFNHKMERKKKKRKTHLTGKPKRKKKH